MLPHIEMEKAILVSKYNYTKDYQTFQSESFGDQKERDKFAKKWREWFPTGFKYEAKEVISIAVPMVVTSLLQIIIPITSNIMCGHLSVNDFGGVVLANGMINAFGFSINMGLCTACDTLFSQGFGGLHKTVVGYVLQKSLMVNSLCVLILISILINVEPIFVLLGQEPEISRIASDFIIIFAPGLFFQMHFTIMGKYMQTQNIIYPTMIIGFIGNLFNALGQYLAVYSFQFGYRGSAIFQALTYLILWILQVAYIIYTEKYKPTWPGWSLKSLEDWKSFLLLAIPGVGHVAFEEIIWEAALFISGIIGAIELGAQSILYQLETLLYMIPLGFGTAVNIRVGHYMGGNNVIGALSCVRTTFTLIILIYIVMVIIIQSCNSVLPLLFAEDKRITSLASDLFYLLSISTITDFVLGVSNGTLRACGRQIIGATTILIGYYLIGFPVLLVLVFVAKMKLLGLWIGLLLGHFIMTVSNIVAVVLTDYQKMANLAVERSKLAKECETHTLSSSELKLAKYLNNCQQKELIIKRILQSMTILLLLCGSILFKLYFPREMYMPNFNNGTTFALNTTIFGNDWE